MPALTTPDVAAGVAVPAAEVIDPGVGVASPWLPGDPVRIGVLAAGSEPPEPDAVLTELTLTLAAPGVADADPRVVVVDDPREVADHVMNRVRKTPRAAWTLDGLLRAVAELDVGPGLVAESLAYSTLLGGSEFARWWSEQPVRQLPSQPANPVQVRRRGDALEIELAHPSRRNAFSTALRAGLAEALEIAIIDPTLTSVSLSGVGPCFSSGGELAEFGTVQDPSLGHLIRISAHPAPLLHRLRDRLTVRVHGPCIGAGVELPSFAGTVVAAPGTTFRLPEIGMGLLPGAGGTVGITKRIGRWRAAYLFLSGVELDTPTALAWGLVDAVV